MRFTTILHCSSFNSQTFIVNNSIQYVLSDPLYIMSRKTFVFLFFCFLLLYSGQHILGPASATSLLANILVGCALSYNYILLADLLHEVHTMLHIRKYLLILLLRVLFMSLDMHMFIMDHVCVWTYVFTSNPRVNNNCHAQTNTHTYMRFDKICHFTQYFFCFTLFPCLTSLTRTQAHCFFISSLTIYFGLDWGEFSWLGDPQVTVVLSRRKAYLFVCFFLSFLSFLSALYSKVCLAHFLAVIISHIYFFMVSFELHIWIAFLWCFLGRPLRNKMNWNLNFTSYLKSWHTFQNGFEILLVIKD